MLFVTINRRIIRYTHNKYENIPLHNLTPNKLANMLRFGATMFKFETSFEVVLREARDDTLGGANPKHCCWVEISRAMDSSRDFNIS